MRRGVAVVFTYDFKQRPYFKKTCAQVGAVRKQLTCGGRPLGARDRGRDGVAWGKVPDSASGQTHGVELAFNAQRVCLMRVQNRSQEHTSELQSRGQLVCR